MSKNPMKPAETEKPDFASEEAGELAVKLNNDGKISTEEIAALKGEGKDGAITVDDIEKALEEKEAAAAAEAEKANDDGDNIVFTTEDVAAFAAEQADKIGFAITDIVGTAKQPPGAIGKKDVDNHIKSIEKAKKAEEKAAEKESEAESKAKDESEDEEGELTLESFFERFMQFSIPVRGALNTKPKVQGQWNKLIADAVKLQKQL